MKNLQNNGRTGRKSWMKSILFSGLIGFNFLTISNGYGALTNTEDLLEDSSLQERINEFVKEHRGFEFNHIYQAILNINSIPDNLLERTNALLEILSP